jgi:hypothetical protein
MESLKVTTHLRHATMVRCYSNAYQRNEQITVQVVDKIMGE